MTKNETITVRIEPVLKEGLKKMTELERSSQANIIEIMIRAYCEDHNVTIPEQQTLFGDDRK